MGRLITVAEYLAKRGVSDKNRRRWGSVFGRLAKRRHIELRGWPPATIPANINGYIRDVVGYRDIDREPVLDVIFSQLEQRLMKEDAD